MTKSKKHIIEEDGEKKIKLSTLVYAVLIALVFALIVASILAYATKTQIGERIRTRIAEIVPFPAAIVDWHHVVFENDVQANLASVEKFYATQNFSSEGLRIDFTTENGKKRLMIKEREILDKMVEDQIIQILAKEKGVTITNVDVENVVQQKLNEFGTVDDVKEDLANSYGWNMDDFKKRVVLPSLYSQALSEKVLSDDQNAVHAKDKINQAKQDLDKGKDFAEVVRTYSEGSSKDKAGELGWVTKDQVLPELQSALFDGKMSDKNSVIESSIGYHIIDIENSKNENGVKSLQLRQVFVSKNTFADWLETQKKQMNVIVSLRDFVWNKDTGSIDFRDQKMREFEKESRAQIQGDASIMY